MASVQNLESRIGVLERKIDFMMKLAKVTKRTPSVLMPGQFVDEQISMLALYHEVNSTGEEIQEISSPEQVNG